MSVHIGLRASFNLKPATGEVEEAHLQEHVWQVMDELLKLEEMADSCVHSAAVSLDLEAMTVDIELAGSGDTYAEAESHIDSAIRSAIHAAGGYTPGWPSCGNGDGGRHEFGLETRSRASEYISA